jgi:ubiquinone/menaquinone biosynthesis C-methylase UbiE
VVSRHVLEHLNNPEKAVAEMYRVTKEGGAIVLVYPFEVIRGMTAVISAYSLYRNFAKARDMHLHKLFPHDVENMFRMQALQ